MRIAKKEYGHTLLTADEDRVFASAPIPVDGRFLRSAGQVHVVAAGVVSITTALIYMTRGVVGLVMNPEVGDHADDLWDSLVNKDVAFATALVSSVVDTDPTTEDTAPFSEPGEGSPTVLAGESPFTERVYDREEILSFAATSDGFLDATPDTYIPNSVFEFRTTHGVHMQDVNGYFLLAHGQGDLENDTQTIPPTLNNQEWLMLRYLNVVLEEAWISFVGLRETGAESPGEDMIVLIRELTEPPMLIESAGAFAVASLNIWAIAVTETYTPGTRPHTSTLWSG